METNMAAPVHCIECGKPAYIPFGENPCCTNKDCRYYDKETGELYKRLNNAKVADLIERVPKPFFVKAKDEITKGEMAEYKMTKGIIIEHEDG